MNYVAQKFNKTLSIKELILIVFYFLLISQSGNAQHLPGGVLGSEIWYISDAQDILNDIFQDHSDYPILIEKCLDRDELITSSLLNFNPALVSKNLCLQFRAPLESLYNKTIFIVAEPEGSNSYPLINSEITDLSVQEVNRVYSENIFIIETNEGFAAKAEAEFDPYNNVHMASCPNL